jgi:enoyl-CoA hydratase
MINHVLSRDDLEQFDNDLARRIAARSSFGLALAKMACNQARDAQGFWTSHQSAFNLWALGHSHERVLTLQQWLEAAGLPTDWTPGRGR